jgi:hypothetical protein
MGREIVYCHLCGIRILEDDLLKGRALTLLDKVFCSGCKAKAFSQMRTDADEGDRTLAPPPQELMDAPAEEPADDVTEQYDEPATRRPAERGVRTMPAERPVRARKNSMMPIAVGGFVGFAATIVLLVILLRRSDVPKPPKPVGSGGPAGTTTGPNSADLAAGKAMAELLKLVSGSAGPDAVLGKCAEIESTVRGTAYAEQFNDIRKDAESVREKTTRKKTFDELIARAKASAGEDKEYARYKEIVKMFEDAREIAARDLPDQVFAIKEALEAYADPYESSAKTAADDIVQLAAQLAKEKRFKDAVKVIDARFPTKYMQSRAWNQLKNQRDAYETQARIVPVGPVKPSDPTDWKGFFRRADSSLGSKDYRKAREDYLRGVQLLPPFSGLNADEKKGVAWGEFNLACTFFIEAKTAAADAKGKANDKGFEYVNKALTDGLAGMACNCHGGAKAHFEKDEDLDAVREDARYKAILAKLK